jgi:hypothetical protein
LVEFILPIEIKDINYDNTHHPPDHTYMILIIVLAKGRGHGSTPISNNLPCPDYELTYSSYICMKNVTIL